MLRVRCIFSPHPHFGLVFPPPRVRNLTVTVDKSFLGEDSLTPSSSASGSRVHSPATPKDGQPLQTPSTAYNIAFSLFPTVRKSHNAPDSPTIPSPSHTSGLYASRAPYSPDMPRSPSPNPFNAMSLMARMNTIAPGPFEPGRGSNDKGSGHSPVAMRFPERSSSRKYSVEQALGQGPFGAWEHGRGESGEYRWKEPSVGDCRGDSAPAVPKVLGRSESITDPSLNTPHGHRMTRAVTMPHTAVEPQVPPSPGRSSTVAVSAGSSTTARAPPHPGVGLPRTPSQFRRHREAKAREIPPPPAPPARERSPPFRQLAAPSTNQYEQSQLHAATLSVSSSSSSAHSHLSKSSMSSPPASDISIASRTKGPQFVDPRTFDHAQHKRPVIPASVGEEIDSLMHDLQFPQPLRREGTPSAPPTDDRDARRPSRSTADRETSPSVPLRDERGVRHPSNSRSRVPPPLSKSSSPPPLDPPNRHATATGPAPNRGHKRTPTAKGPCRGCGEQIIGKSISSADGRLSGRYHRACFVCQTCRQPFQSAEFYVLDDLPFCHHHYHELNRSLCGVCNYGIEGPCLETVQRERFHPGCFTCVVSFPPPPPPFRNSPEYDVDGNTV